MALNNKRGPQRYSTAPTVTDRRRGGQISIWMEPDEFQLFDAIARKRNISRGALAREALYKFMKENIA